MTAAEPSSFAPAPALRHRCFEAAAVSRLVETRLTDQMRAALLLQGAAVLAHLDHAGWHLPRQWEEAGVDAEGTLCLPTPAPGRSRMLPQEQLRRLLALLFGSDEVAGRGEARRAVRTLMAGWQQSLIAVSPDRAVAEILEEAPFLWRAAFAAARRALVAEHRREVGWSPWVVGPGPNRRRLLAAGKDRDALEALLAGEEARTRWEGEEGEAATELAAAGRWQAAVKAWARRPPTTPGERVQRAEALFALGRFKDALEALQRLRSAEARLLRVRCQVRLGRLAAARRGLGRLATARWTPEQTLELAEVAVRVLANLGETEEMGAWVERAAEVAGGSLAPRAALLAAVAAWDAGEPEAMAEPLARAQAARDDPRLAWRWHTAHSLAAMEAGDHALALTHLRRALTDRRRLKRFEAGELWNQMGVCRAGLGDLAGAERAFLHTVRLLGGCDGPRATTLALYNLAEIRLRRGRLVGVREIIEQATLENRLSGNVRGGIQDAELWARFELAHGRAHAALAHCSGALEELRRRGLDWRRPVLSVLAARALGWLGRTDEAAAALDASDRAALAELEPEERPALLALAGRREEALQAAGETPLARLWESLLVERQTPTTAWQAAADLDPYRTARLVFDAELVAPGAAPPHWRRRAAATFRRLGAVPQAERLEALDLDPWQRLGRYLAEPPRPGAVQDLFAQLGYGEARLTWHGEAGETILLDGRGGGEELAAPVGEGRLVLAAEERDPVLEALFALAVRDVPVLLGPALSGSASGGRAPTGPEAEERPRPRRRPGGMVGDSPALAAALDRLERLAPGDLPLLIQGESGTGKELAARLAHRLSARAERPFVAMNCAAVAENLLLSDLFGHVRGSFTGADRDRAGVFETAQGGTVFLDEIGDLPPSAQGMLLRVLQEGEVRRVGESLPRKVRVRVVTATHRDLAAMVREGTFRQDLYFRLKVAAVELPPLREREGDVLLLAEHFLRRMAVGAPAPQLSPAARRRLVAHSWPGNVRELENVLRVAVALAGGGDGAACTVEPEHLDLPATLAAEAGAVAGVGDYHTQVSAFRRQLVARALEAAGGNRAEAARQLGLSRQALSYLARQLRVV